MVLVGSRAVGVNYANSDYDYIELDADVGERTNEHFAHKKHCYHFNKVYMYRVFQFKENDMMFMFNALHYKVGINPFNPFEYRDKWLTKLKNLDISYFMDTQGGIKKRFYHIVYNLECLKENTLNPRLDRVQLFHDKKATKEEFEEVLGEIQHL